MSWLVTGGAGYIGAHVVRALCEGGQDVVVLDDLSTGRADRVVGAELVVGSVSDAELVARTLREHRVSGVVHVAARKQVGESVEQPYLYYRENLYGQLVLMEAMREAGVEQFVFSSSASVYGMPDVELVTEDTPVQPISPYGQTKAAGEWLAQDAGAAYGVRYANLRYFNVAGAASDELGDPAVLNLVPMVLERLTAKQRPKVFGDDYPTPDGTCVRDYIHVEDVASAHLAAARHLAGSGASLTLNIGRGEGSSVSEVLAVVAEVTGLDTTPEVVGRRAGDPARIVASARAIQDTLGWSASHDLRSMVGSAWSAWRAKKPQDLGRPSAR